MNRRKFLFQGLMLSFGLDVLIKNAMAAVNWVKPGTAGYKEVAPPNQAKINKQCSTCKWYKADNKVEGGGLCTQSVIAKGKEVYVKAAGFCPMWRS